VVAGLPAVTPRQLAEAYFGGKDPTPTIKALFADPEFLALEKRLLEEKEDRALQECF
jgi:hypothetical protein